MLNISGSSAPEWLRDENGKRLEVLRRNVEGLKDHPDAKGAAT